jgi:hypothetical protein
MDQQTLMLSRRNLALTITSKIAGIKPDGVVA